MSRRHGKPEVSESYRRAFPELDSTQPGCRCANCEPPLARRVLSWRRNKPVQHLSLTGACIERIGFLRARKRPSANAKIHRSKRS